MYKHFPINDANRSTDDATSKHATQTETKTMQLQNFKKRHNFEADAEQGGANRGISVYILTKYYRFCFLINFLTNLTGKRSLQISQVFKPIIHSNSRKQ